MQLAETEWEACMEHTVRGDLINKTEIVLRVNVASFHLICYFTGSQ